MGFSIMDNAWTTEQDACVELAKEECLIKRNYELKRILWCKKDLLRSVMSKKN